MEICTTAYHRNMLFATLTSPARNVLQSPSGLSDDQQKRQVMQCNRKETTIPPPNSPYMQSFLGMSRMLPRLGRSFQLWKLVCVADVRPARRPLSTLLLAWLIFLVLRVSVVRVRTDPGAEEVKDKGDCTASQANEAE